MSSTRLLVLILFLALAAVACRRAPQAAAPVTDVPAAATDVPAAAVTPAPTAGPTATPAPTPTARPRVTDYTITDLRNLTDADRRYLMYELSEASSIKAYAALDQAVASGDERLVPVLIEILRAGQLGIVPWGYSSELVSALEALSGQAFSGNWFEWIEWYGTTDIVPPDGFTSWKGRLLAQIDPRFGQFFQDSYPSTLRVEEIQWGGVVVDGIPALREAAQIGADSAEYLAPDDAVFGLSINGDHRAYPLRIMDWHEMANDVVGGVPVSIAYCTLCGAAIAFDGRAPDGNTYTFGSSGFLYRSNKLMYDHQTLTLWNQLTGEPVLGALAAQDVRLKVLPIVLTTWADWRAQHPTTTVLDSDTGYSRDYSSGAAYADYFASPETMFPVWQRSTLLPDKSHVYALRLNGQPKAYPIDVLLAERVSNDTLGGTAIVLVTSGDAVTVTGQNRRSDGAVTYGAGAQVRAYERGEQQFVAGDSAETLRDATGALWTVTEDALIGPDGTTLPRLGGHLAYWFGWFAFFPDTAVYGQ